MGPVEARYPFLHRQRRAHRRSGIGKGGHDRVAHRLHDGAVLLAHDLGQEGEMLAHQMVGTSVTDPLVERGGRSEEHTSELQSLMRISYAVFCLKKKKKKITLHR